MGYGNPVPGPILAPKAARTGAQFIVTRTCADHRQTGQGCALDIWNGRCDGPVFAAEAGQVTYRYDPEGIIRISHPNGDRSDYAHMRGIGVRVGQSVTRGQQIGTVSDAHSASIPNFSGCHLHFAIVRRGVEIDPWPLLDQNASGGGTTTMPVIQALEGYPPGAAIEFVAGKQYQFFAFDNAGKRTSWAWTPPAGTSAGTEALVTFVGEAPAHHLPKVWDGAAFRTNAYLPNGYAPAVFPPAPQPIPPGPVITTAQLEAAKKKAAHDAAMDVADQAGVPLVTEYATETYPPA